MDIQYVSDIYLEKYSIKNIPYINPTAPYLVLCGNIGYPTSNQYELFLKDCSLKFKLVFIISGNYEYHRIKRKRRSINEIEENLYKLCNKYENIYFLQNSFVLLDSNIRVIYYGSDINIISQKNAKYIIVGSVLWTCIPEYIEPKDYQKIYKFSETTRFYPNINMLDIINMYNISLDYLEKINLTGSKIPMLILTYYIPPIEFIRNKSSNSQICLVNHMDINKILKIKDLD